MKRLAIACAFFFLSFHATAQTIYSCDFEKGIPADFTLIDYDKNEPSQSMQKQGFSVGTPWITLTPIKDASGKAACSTSWYTKTGTSDDWMILPKITISGNNPFLSWRGMASDAKHADGYTVYISETGSTEKSGFNTTKPLFTTESETSHWTEHSVSLAQYIGKSVTIAYVNNSTDCSRLYIDDINIAERHKLSFSLDLTNNINYAGEVNISGLVSTTETIPIDGFTIGVEANGETTTQHFDTEVSNTKPATFSLKRKLTIGKHETVSYKVWAENDGDKNEQEFSITSYPRKIVCEEGTGTWCGYCVRGIVILDSIKKHYPDRIIGIAAHTGDPMQSDYINEIGKYLGSSYPTGTVNRRQRCDPKDFIKMAYILLNGNETLVDIDLKTSFDKTTRTVRACTTLHFAEGQPNNTLALAYAILENAIHRPGDEKYRQHNSYANGKSGIMGGYEKYGEYIPSEVMYYNDVARGFIGDLMGIEGSIPPDLEAEQPIVDERIFTLPDNIFVDDNVEIVSMLIDKSDGRIINAQNAELVPGASCIRGIKEEQQATRLYIYDINGAQHNSIQHGLNIIRTASGKVMKTIK